MKTLSEQNKEEMLVVKTEKKAKSKKILLVLFAVIVLIIAGVIGVIKYGEYHDSLPGKYMSEYQEALNNGEYDKAKEVYKKYLGFYDPNKRELVTDVNRYDDSLTELTDKDAIIANSIKDFSEKCDKMKLADEAFAYIINGDYENGNKIFDNEDVYISQVPRNHLEKQIPELLDKIHPLQVCSGGSSLYWVNADGTIGRIGGSAVVDNWGDIVEIKVNYGNSVAGLKGDGTLINSMYESYTVNDVADFDIYNEYLVANKTDGTVLWYAGGGSPNIQSGFEDVLNWSNVKAVKLTGTEYAKTEIIDPDGCYHSEYANLQFETVGVPCLLAETNDGKKLISAYNVKIIYPTAEEAANSIVNSIDGNGWNDVVNYLQGQALSTGSSGGSVAKVERVPLQPTGNSSFDNSNDRFEVYNILFELSPDGKWVVHN